MDLIGNDPSSRNLIKQMMLECQKVGEAVGVNFGVSIDKRIDGASSIIGQVAVNEGMRTLRDDGWQKVMDGQTTIEEILRVTMSDEHLKE